MNHWEWVSTVSPLSGSLETAKRPKVSQFNCQWHSDVFQLSRSTLYSQQQQSRTWMEHDKTSTNYIWLPDGLDSTSSFTFPKAYVQQTQSMRNSKCPSLQRWARRLRSEKSSPSHGRLDDIRGTAGDQGLPVSHLRITALSGLRSSSPMLLIQKKRGLVKSSVKEITFQRLK
jgi:hypothetical protein